MQKKLLVVVVVFFAATFNAVLRAGKEEDDAFRVERSQSCGLDCRSHKAQKVSKEKESGFIKKGEAKISSGKASDKNFSPQDFIVEKSAYGRTVSCPVMKKRFKINKNTPGIRYKGKEYYMCCPACAAPFKKEPQKYLIPDSFEKKK